MITKAARLPENEIILQGVSYHSFINAIRSPATKKGYENSIIRYCRHLKLKDIDDLLVNGSSPKVIESQIIDYIMTLRQNNVAYKTIKFLIAPIFTFYQLNDIVLNRKKVSRYLGEFKRIVKDTPYTTEQIQQMLQNADQRTRMIILLLASTGCRIGALPTLTLGNLTKIPGHGLYRVTFYEGTNNEYYTFTTRECAQTGIDNYLEYRKRSGENLHFNENTNCWEPSNSPLIRLQFDINDILQIRCPEFMSLSGLRMSLYYHLIKCGLRQIEHLTESDIYTKVRKSVSFSTGFRKHVISIFIKAQLNHEIRELISDHSTHLDQHYFRPTEEQVLSEYMKAEPFLTIDKANKLEIKVQKLTEERGEVEILREKVRKLESETIYFGKYKGFIEKKLLDISKRLDL